MEVTQPSTVMGPPLPAELSLEVPWLEGDCWAKANRDNNRIQDSRDQVRIRSSGSSQVGLRMATRFRHLREDLPAAAFHLLG